MKKTLLIVPALLVLMLVWAAPAHSTGPAGEWHTWEVQGDYGPNWDQNYAEAFAQPQRYVGEGKLSPKCGTWYQQDNYRYPGHGKTIAEVIEDGLLRDGEDHHLTNWGGEGTAWKFVYGGPCVDPEPTPEPDEETHAYYGASSCVPGVEGLAVQSFGVDFYVNGELVPEKSKSWTEHVADPGCTLPTPDPQEDVAPPALPVEAEATFTG